jgi:polysaccharide export outer membrane protein
MKPIPIFFAVLLLFFITHFDVAFSGQNQQQNKEYIIGAGDRLAIQVWDHKDLSRVVEVSPNGTFSFPFIGKVQASGKTVFMIENSLVQKLADGYLVGPQVTVSVSEYNNKKAFLFGEVRRPGSYVLRKDMRLLELISDAGGFSDQRGMLCTIVRAPETGMEAKPVPLDNASDHEILTVNLTKLTAGDPQANVLILPNDTIYVSAAERIFITGEVKKPGEVGYKEGMTVRQAVSMAGGGTAKAAIGRIRIVRMDDGREVEIKPDLSDRVLPNDILKVPESFF